MLSKYSIKDLEHLSGIKAHTIRAWESRYKLIEPHRTATNIRYYVDEDLKRILNVSVLVKAGHKISKVANMSPEQINSAVLDAGRYQGNYESQITALKKAMLDYDEYLFDSVFDKCLIQFGTDETLTKILAPYIHQIGVLWQTCSISVSNEHFVSNLVKQKMFSIIDQTAVPQPDKAKRSYLLYLPSNELHELGLLYLYYYLRKSGYRVIYLGQSVPIQYVKEVADKTGINEMISIFTSCPHTNDLNLYFERWSELFDEDKFQLHLTGYQLSEAFDLSLPSNVNLQENLQELTQSLA